MQSTAWTMLFCMKLKSFNKISMDIYFTEFIQIEWTMYKIWLKYNLRSKLNKKCH
jgi:hypothetical protein